VAGAGDVVDVARRVAGAIEERDLVPLNVVVLGAPGAGKGTQAEELARDAGVPKISTGDILRQAAAEGTALGLAAKAVMDEGRLVGDDVMIGLVGERLARPDARRGFVLDGFPRTVAQARALDGLMAGRGGLLVVVVNVPDDEIVRRLAARRVCERCGSNRPPLGEPSVACPKCGGAFVERPDDAEAVVRERLRVFGRQTGPLVGHYRTQAAFLEVNGDQVPADVARDVRQALDRALAARSAGRS
jgi:adenylate kinase